MDVLEYDIQRLDNMKANDIYNIIPMVCHLKNGAKLFEFEDHQSERTTQKSDLFKIMDKMVT